MNENQNEKTHDSEKPKGGFGKIKTYTNYYGLHLTLDLEKMKKQRDDTSSDNKIDVLIIIDGIEVSMSFEEFKSRLLKLD